MTATSVARRAQECYHVGTNIDVAGRALARPPAVAQAGVSCVSDPDCSTSPGNKTCSRCRESKPLDLFVKNKGRADGRGQYCLMCHNAISAARRASHPEASRAAAIKYHAENAERIHHRKAERRLANVEAARDAERARRRANPQISRDASRRWRAANPEKVRAKAAEWAARNPNLVRELSSRRRARKRGAPLVETIDRAVVWERDAGRCHICGRKADPYNWHLEHLIPLALGGEHSYRNVAVSHPACNARKGVRGPAQLRLEV